MSVPSDETERVAELAFSFASDSGRTAAVRIGLASQNNLVRFELSPVQNRVTLGEPARFVLHAFNESLAPHDFDVVISPSEMGFLPSVLSVSDLHGPAAQASFDVVLEHVGYGRRDFELSVVSRHNGRVAGAFRDSVTVQPTLLGKWSVSTSALPFLSPPMNVFVFLNALVARVFA